VGEGLLRALSEQGWQAIGLTLSDDSAAKLRSSGLKVMAADIRQHDFARNLQAKSFSLVVHCASSAGGGSESYEALFECGTRNVFAALEIEHFLFVSSTSVYAQTDGSSVDELSPAEPGQISASLPPDPPVHGESFPAMLADMDKLILPGITHWQSPNFYAFFPSNASGPAILGDLLSSGLNVQGMLWATSPACTELETHVLDWLVGMMGLPQAFLSTSTGGGVIQDTASSASLCALLAAFLGGWLLHVLVERPALRFRDRLLQRGWFGGAGRAVAVGGLDEAGAKQQA